MAKTLRRTKWITDKRLWTSIYVNESSCQYYNIILELGANTCLNFRSWTDKQISEIVDRNPEWRIQKLKYEV